MRFQNSESHLEMLLCLPLLYLAIAIQSKHSKPYASEELRINDSILINHILNSRNALIMKERIEWKIPWNYFLRCSICSGVYLVHYIYSVGTWANCRPWPGWEHLRSPTTNTHSTLRCSMSFFKSKRHPETKKLVKWTTVPPRDNNTLCLE